ncbi:MAG: hypothetical protein LBG97_03020 [Coriobacteriales bacterium]|jgi:hypothetical protein|nr:hypothetical protein [Coriobacteriales bacterium]
MVRADTSRTPDTSGSDAARAAEAAAASAAASSATQAAPQPKFRIETPEEKAASFAAAKEKAAKERARKEAEKARKEAEKEKATPKRPDSIGEKQSQISPFDIMRQMGYDPYAHLTRNQPTFTRYSENPQIRSMLEPEQTPSTEANANEVTQEAPKQKPATRPSDVMYRSDTRRAGTPNNADVHSGNYNQADDFLSNKIETPEVSVMKLDKARALIDKDKPDGLYDLIALETINFATGYQVTPDLTFDNPTYRWSDEEYACCVNIFRDLGDGIAYAGKFAGEPEISLLVEDRALAIELGRKYNQQSVLDWATLNEGMTNTENYIKVCETLGAEEGEKILATFTENDIHDLITYLIGDNRPTLIKAAVCNGIREDVEKARNRHGQH